MSVKLELYRVFKEVAEVGNITAAAQTPVSYTHLTLPTKLEV